MIRAGEGRGKEGIGSDKGGVKNVTGWYEGGVM